MHDEDEIFVVVPCPPSLGRDESGKWRHFDHVRLQRFEKTGHNFDPEEEAESEVEVENGRSNE